MPPLAREIVFPRVVGKIGDELPGKADPRLADFAGIEQPNWPNSLQGRLKWVADPAGGSVPVIRWELRHGDECTAQYGTDGQRVELWPEPFDEVPGTSAWFVIQWLLGDGVTGDAFRQPSGWALMFQNFDKGGGSPPFALEIGKTNQVTAGACDWIGNARTAPANENGRKKLAPATLGHWHSFLISIKFEQTAAGQVTVWHAQDGLPKLTDPFVEQWTQRTLYDGQAHPTLHLYREPKAAGEYPWVAYSKPFVRAATAARALELAGGGTPGPPSPAAAQAAIDAIRASNPKITDAIQKTLDYAKATT